MPFVICIDPGHGAPFPGVVANGLVEAEVAFDVSWRLARILAEKQINVVMTRPGTQALDRSSISRDLSLRAYVANQVDADRFISIHCNGFSTGEPNGHEVFYHKGSAVGQRLAESIERSLVRSFPTMNARGARKDTEVHKSGFKVLRETAMPAVLVELGFLSNVNDAGILSIDGERDRFAKAIADAILRDLR